MNVLVTGGTGYLGRAVVRALHGAGHTVVLYGRSSSQVAAGTAVPVTPVDGDVRDARRLAEAARGCDGIVHMAALVAVWRQDPREFDAVNVLGLRNVLDAARTAGITRIVHTSSFLALTPGGLVRPPAWNDYQRTKAAADRVAAAAIDAGAPVVRLYPGVVYGPGVMTEGNLVGRQIADHLAGRLHGIVGAARTWSFSFIDDVAAAHVAAVERGRAGPRYLLGGVNAPQLRPFEIVRELTGHPLPRRLPAWAIAVAAAGDELRAAWIGGAPLVTTGTLEILLRDWPLESSLAQEELGYRVTPLDDGVRAIIDELGHRPASPGPRGEST